MPASLPNCVVLRRPLAASAGARLVQSGRGQNMSDKRPKLLIVALDNWHSIARLPRTLQRAGFEVAALCCPNSFLASTRYLDQCFSLRSKRLGSRICRQVADILTRWQPQMVVPGDDRTVLFFQGMLQLHREGKLQLAPALLEILRFSFGNFNWPAEATSKHLTLQRANKLGIKTPRFACAHSLDDAVSLADEMGWPVVVKKSTGWGGGGVAFCDNKLQVETTYRKYSEAARWKGRVKLRIIQLRGWSLGTAWHPADRSVTINEAIRGEPAMIAVAAINGKVLSHVTAIKVECSPQLRGPSSVVRFIQHSGISQAVEKLVGQWGATGLLGFDYMLAANGEASLIECNPRPISLTHIGCLSGCDPVLALHHHLTGLEIPAPSAPHHAVVVHFPNEWRRDPQSHYLVNAWHDVPWDDPGLLEKLMKV
jgi:hypothetical protein